MAQNAKKVGMYLLQIVLTALASAGIALLQHYVEAHGANAGPALDTVNTGAIGGMVSMGRVALKEIKITKLG